MVEEKGISLYFHSGRNSNGMATILAGGKRFFFKLGREVCPVGHKDFDEIALGLA